MLELAQMCRPYWYTYKLSANRAKSNTHIFIYLLFPYIFHYIYIHKHHLKFVFFWLLWVDDAWYNLSAMMWFSLLYSQIFDLERNHIDWLYDLNRWHFYIQLKCMLLLVFTSNKIELFVILSIWFDLIGFRLMTFKQHLPLHLYGYI